MGGSQRHSFNTAKLPSGWQVVSSTSEQAPPSFPKSNTSWVGYDFNFSIENLYLTGITKISDSINGKIYEYINDEEAGDEIGYFENGIAELND